MNTRLTNISSMATREVLADVADAWRPPEVMSRSDRWAVSRWRSECKMARSSTSWCWPPRRSTSGATAVTADCADGHLGDLATSFKARGARAPGHRCRRARREDVRRDALGSVNIPVVCAGALVNAGDVVVAVDDGPRYID
jgi:hypothetical protein